jgi:hypothetical protein
MSRIASSLAALRRSLAAWAAPLALLLHWELAVFSGLLPRRLLPAPSAVLWTALEASLHGDLLGHTGARWAGARQPASLGNQRAAHPTRLRPGWARRSLQCAHEHVQERKRAFL